MKIGILGCGHIARKVASMLVSLDGIEVVAIASRRLEKAEVFARDFSIPRYYGSYEELVEDEDVELVYITTIHSLHYEHMMLCLEHGKHVICEKAFTINAHEAEKVFDVARERKLFVTEAIWTRYQPVRALIDNLIEKIGRITSIDVCLGYELMHKERVRDKKQGGGALLDIGLYPINFVLMAQTKSMIKSMTGLCTKSEEGVDVRDELLFSFFDGSTAHMCCDAETTMYNGGIIQGTEGRIEVDNINNPTCVRLYLKSEELAEEHKINHNFNGYEYEFMETVRLIEEGKLESESMPWSETVRVMRIMDTFRRLWSIKLGNEE